MVKVAKYSMLVLFFRFVHRTDFVPLRKVFEVTPLKSEPAQDGVKIVIIYSSSANVASISDVGREYIVTLISWQNDDYS